tara:strand:- start:294 stop:551 length:258 start_codon:yes stop_codon:yes gene_type:complete
LGSGLEEPLPPLAVLLEHGLDDLVRVTVGVRVRNRVRIKVRVRVRVRARVRVRVRARVTSCAMAISSWIFMRELAVTDIDEFIDG